MDKVEDLNLNATSIFPVNRGVIDKVFVTCLICLISIANILMGCELDLNVVMSTIRRPFAPAIGMFTQFVVMPLLAYSLALFLLSDEGMHLLALGLFVTGCSPGGGASNYWTLLLGGNTNLSVTMTFISTIGAMVTMPLWIRMLAPTLVHAINPTTTLLIPYSKMITSLICLVLPILLGLLIARWRPKWAQRMKKLLRPFIISVLIFIIVFGVTINLWLLKLVTWRILLAGILLPLCGFMFGCFAAILFHQSVPDVTAIAIETGVQNTGIAIMVLTLSFPGVHGDMASLLPIVVACGTPLPLVFGHLMCRLFRRRQQQRTTTPSSSSSNSANGSQDCCEAALNAPMSGGGGCRFLRHSPTASAVVHMPPSYSSVRAVPLVDEAVIEKEEADGMAAAESLDNSLGEEEKQPNANNRPTAAAANICHQPLI